MNAPQLPFMTTPKKASCNSDAAHGKLDGEQTESEIEAEEEVEGSKRRARAVTIRVIKFEVQATRVT